MDFKLRSTNELVGIIEQIRSWHYRVDQNCNVLTQETLTLSVYHIVIMAANIKYKISTTVVRASVLWWRNCHNIKHIINYIFCSGYKLLIFYWDLDAGRCFHYQCMKAPNTRAFLACWWVCTFCQKQHLTALCAWIMYQSVYLYLHSVLLCAHWTLLLGWDRHHGW